MERLGGHFGGFKHFSIAPSLAVFQGATAEMRRNPDKARRPMTAFD